MNTRFIPVGQGDALLDCIRVTDALAAGPGHTKSTGAASGITLFKNADSAHLNPMRNRSILDRRCRQ